jgi:hypothetical protein
VAKKRESAIEGPGSVADKALKTYTKLRTQDAGMSQARRSEAAQDVSNRYASATAKAMQRGYDFATGKKLPDNKKK